MTHPILLMSFGVSLVLTVADKLPEFDIGASCKEVAGFGLAFQDNPEREQEVCVADEKKAQDALRQKWSKYPAAERDRCVGEATIGTPSYVDVLTCLEMTQQAEQEMREMTQGAEAPHKSLIGASKAKRGVK